MISRNVMRRPSLLRVPRAARRRRPTRHPQVFRLEVGVSREDTLAADTGRHESEQGTNRDAQTADAGLAAHHGRIESDAIEVHSEFPCGWPWTKRNLAMAGRRALSPLAYSRSRAVARVSARATLRVTPNRTGYVPSIAAGRGIFEPDGAPAGSRKTFRTGERPVRPMIERPSLKPESIPPCA